VFVRQDIPLAHQIVQSNHALLTVSAAVVINDIPNIILIGVPDLPALNRVKSKLIANGIVHSEWVEPDMDMGFTAMATVPLTVEEKIPLAHYRLWQYSPVAQRAEQLANRKVCESMDVRAIPGEPTLSASSLAAQSKGF
jgi:transcriptional regulator of nitric oxide reductase